MAGLNVGTAPGNAAVLPFYATGALMFMALTLLMFFSPESFTQHYFSPHLLTMVHVAALGWGTMVIFGAAYQLLPVICERNLYSEKLAAFSWYSLTLGVILLVVNFWRLTVGWVMISGGLLIVVSAVLFLLNIIKTAGSSALHSALKILMVSSGFWLLFTASVGVLLATNLKYPFFKVSHLEILKLHAHAGLAGWFLQLITAVSSRLIPMFLLAKTKNENLLWWALVLQNIGLLLFLADGYFFGISVRVFIYAGLVGAGIVCWLLYLYGAFRQRLRKKIELLMKHAFLSLLSLVIAVLLLPAVYFSAGYAWASLYGTMLFMGWITSLILGKTFKTLPFIIWNDRYKNLSGKVKVPLPKQLYSERLVRVQFWSFVAAFVIFASGIIFKQTIVIRFGAFLWCVVALLYNLNVFKVILHKKIDT